ncbi:MAG: diphthine synthase [Thermoplasmata archaeon]|nr:diphthine synthase [Thermoplasmata archaeon]
MADLWFVGAGLGDERDLSRRAVDLLRRCSAVFCEEYTSILAHGSFERLSLEIGRPIVRLERPELESADPILDALAQGGPVALVVPGDPFAATTHGSLRAAAVSRGHSVHYLPGASILTAAAGFLGLNPYGWGRVTSLPFPAPAFAPTSPIETIRRNRSSGLHTLILLDLRPEEGRFLGAQEALRILEERDPAPDGIATHEVAVVARLGTETAAAWYGMIPALRALDFGQPLHALVVPGPDLHFTETAALERFRVR